jgi:hypothetical protein
MTTQTQREPLYQVWATETATGKLVAVPFFPRVRQEAADEFVASMVSMIRLGKEKRYADPQALPHLGELVS